MLETLVRHLDMVRLSVGALAVVAMVGCTGLIDNGNSSGNDTPEQRVAKQKWLDEALPQFTSTCISCHNGSRADVGFLVGTADLDIRDTLMGFDPQVVDLDAPQSSRILTKGLHDGPALLADQASALLDWVEAEKEALPPPDGTGPILQTAEFTPILCTGGAAGDPTCPFNHVDLTPTGLPGATIDFIAQPLGSGLYINQLSLTAAVDGAYIEHPLFVSWPGGGTTPVPDDIDRFFNVKLDLMAALTSSIGGGTAAFVGFVATDPVSIHFKVVKPYQPDTGTTGPGTGATGGCKMLPQFKTSAQGPLNTNCATCHTTAGATSNPSAISAMDLDGIAAADDPTILLACNQVRSRINFQNTDQSGFYIAPNPADQTNHPFKFGNVQASFDAFKTSVDAWVQAEKTSP